MKNQRDNSGQDLPAIWKSLHSNLSNSRNFVKDFRGPIYQVLYIRHWWNVLVKLATVQNHAKANFPNFHKIINCLTVSTPCNSLVTSRVDLPPVVHL